MSVTWNMDAARAASRKKTSLETPVDSGRQAVMIAVVVKLESFTSESYSKGSVPEPHPRSCGRRRRDHVDRDWAVALIR